MTEQVSTSRCDSPLLQAFVDNRLILVKIAARITGCRSRAEDVVQDVMLEASQRLTDYLRNPGMPFHLWLRQLALDRIIDMHRRHRGAQRRSVDRDQNFSGVGNDEQSAADLAALQAIPADERAKFVLVVQDPFNSFYDAGLVYRFIQLIETLGLKPVLLPFKPNGKPTHIKGFLGKFAKTAQSSADFLNQVHKLGMPMVGIDPALVLCYRDEYKEILGANRGAFEVKLANEWLLSILQDIPTKAMQDKQFTWFSHCTESTAKPNTANEWSKIFTHFGAKLTAVNLGCCGMAGTYGHEAENLERSKTLFDMSWKDTLSKMDASQVLVSGYSCRSQVKRFAGYKPKHPLEALLELVKA